MARSEAKANLLLALYLHASHDLKLLRAEANLLRNQLVEVRSELAQASRQLGDANRQLGDANRQLGEAHNEVERVHRQLNDARNACDRLTEHGAKLEEQHTALLASTSWRITAPIRAVIRVMKRQ